MDVSVLRRHPLAQLRFASSATLSAAVSAKLDGLVEFASPLLEEVLACHCSTSPCSS